MCHTATSMLCATATAAFLAPRRRRMRRNSVDKYVSRLRLAPPGRFDQCAAQPAIALASLAALPLAGTLPTPGTDARPGRQVGRIREGAHVDADLGDNHLSRPPAHSR